MKSFSITMTLLSVPLLFISFQSVKEFTLLKEEKTTFPKDGKIDFDFVMLFIENLKKAKYPTREDLQILLNKVKEILVKQDTIIDITIEEDEKITICGDIHGDFYDLLNIFDTNGYPSERNPYLFNGDFVDRGYYGLECIVTLLCFKLLYPGHFFLTRGNHEEITTNQAYGFYEEMYNKYGDESVYLLFADFYRYLPLGHVINNKVLVLHGGLYNQTISLDEVKKFDRFNYTNIYESSLMTDILWSDPMLEDGVIPSYRGAGINFGEDFTKKFLEDNGLELLIRSHESKPDGYEIQHDGKLITVFSVPNYGGKGNLGAYIILSGTNLTQEIITFEAVRQPSN